MVIDGWEDNIKGPFFLTMWYLSWCEEEVVRERGLKPVFIPYDSVESDGLIDAATENDIYAGLITGRFTEVEHKL